MRVGLKAKAKEPTPKTTVSSIDQKLKVLKDRIALAKGTTKSMVSDEVLKQDMDEYMKLSAIKERMISLPEADLKAVEWALDNLEDPRAIDILVGNKIPGFGEQPEGEGKGLLTKIGDLFR